MDRLCGCGPSSQPRRETAGEGCSPPTPTTENRHELSQTAIPKGFHHPLGRHHRSDQAALGDLLLNAVIFTQFRTVFNNFFQPSLQRSEALTTATGEITERIEAEGIVLLRNRGHALPLAQDERKVNVFGWSSTMPVYGGTGPAPWTRRLRSPSSMALENAGIEYNTEITDFYSAFRTNRPVIAIRARDWTVPRADHGGVRRGRHLGFGQELLRRGRRDGLPAPAARAPTARSPEGMPGDIKKVDLPDGRTVDYGARRFSTPTTWTPASTTSSCPTVSAP